MNFTVKEFELVNVFKGIDIGYEEISKVGIYTKELEYYGGGEPEIRKLTIFTDIRDGEILEMFVADYKNILGEN